MAENKPGTSGTSKKGKSKVKWEKTGNPVWDAYGKAWENDTNAGREFTAGVNRGRPSISGIVVKPKAKNDKSKIDKGNRSSWKGTGSTNLADQVILKRPELSAYKWNLPPHKWSLPVQPIVLNNEANSLGTVFDQAGQGSSTIEQYRRGRLWWYASVDSIMEDASGTDPRKSVEDRAFGFQFLWNPESYSTGVSLNTDVTPSVSDRFTGVAGAFPSGETISFTLRLDRTNDFAMGRYLLDKNYEQTPKFDKKGNAVYKPSPTNPYTFAGLLDYYQSGLGNMSQDDRLQQIKDLMELGTVADLEYLYKAVNGDGWVNAAGRPTSDIGYLAATLLRVDIGPLSYIGYILSLNVNHIAFNQDMTPIRTDVSVSMNLMASAGQSFANTGENKK